MPRKLFFGIALADCLHGNRERQTMAAQSSIQHPASG
jgi:hypothetical protein